MRLRRPRSSAVLAAAVAACLAGLSPVASASPIESGASWLEWMGLLPAQTYDPDGALIPRRRPGHPVTRIEAWDDTAGGWAVVAR